MTDMLAPYNLANDNTIQLLFILNIIGICYVLMMNGANIFERAKCIFYYENKSTPYNDRTHVTRICNLLMDFQTIFYVVIICYALLGEHIIDMTKNSSAAIMGALAAILTLAFLIKRGIQFIANSILFSNAISREWDSFSLFTTRLSGFALAPAAIAILFVPAISMKSVEIYSILIIIAYFYTTINNLNKIIFIKNRIYIDIFLYLCALEFLPMAMVWKTVLQLDDFITIKI